MASNGHDEGPRIPELADRYGIVRELGRKRTSVVYLARDREVGRDVAIELIRAADAGGEDAVARLLREIRAVGRLQHPNIVMLLDVRHLQNGDLVLIHPFVPGRTLKERIVEEGPLPFADVRRILHDLAGALAHAHRHGLLHGDVRPERVHLDENTGVARFAGFGPVRWWNDDLESGLPDTALGTPTYMAPEQLDRRRLDGRSDLYSLGLLGWEMLTGKRPWEGEDLYGVIQKQKSESLPSVENLRPGVPGDLRAAIEGALAKDPAQRWPNAEAFVQRLETGSPRGSEQQDGGDRPVGPRSARPPDPGHSTVPALGDVVLVPTETSDEDDEDAPRRRRPARLGALLVLALLAITGGVVFATGSVGRTGPFLDHLRPLVVAFETWSEGGDDRPDPGSEGLQAIEEEDLDPATNEEGTARPATVPPSGRSTEPPDGDLEGDAVPARILVTGGTFQEAPPGESLADSVVVRVEDAEGNPVAGVQVELRVASGGGSIQPGTVRTDGDGVARAAWTLGRIEGTQELAAEVRGSDDLSVAVEARTTPVELPVQARVVAGGLHSCRLGSSGRLHCWGTNEHGQLADGMEGQRRLHLSQPVQGHVFALVASGVSHTCALDREGQAFCWGQNDRGQLGNETNVRRVLPAPVAAGLRFTTLDAGASHTCALADGGIPYCWGDNAHGQLGNETREGRPSPGRVSTSSSFRSISVGWGHTCALDGEGRASCWGRNSSGELGLGDTYDRIGPTPLPGGYRFNRIFAGNAHTCGITTAQEVLCWGSNGSGQLGDGTTMDRATPRPVVSGERFTEVTAGGVHTCALAASGTAYCWGGNGYGQLGDGSTQDRLAPVPVQGALQFRSLHARGSHTCGQTGDRLTYCWGYNVEGQLGDGTRQNRPGPTEVREGGR